MLSGILNTETAILVNIDIIRAFIALRQYFHNYKDIVQRVEGIEDDINSIYKTLDYLVAQKAIDEKPPNRIGFRIE